MVVKYKTDFCESYMLVEIPEDVERQQYSFKMLEKNRINGVLSCKERMEDGKAYLYIDISGKNNLLQEYKDKEIELEDMILFFQQLIPVLEELKKYLLSEKMVVLDPEYIFRNMEDGSLYITILPWEREEEQNLHKLAEFFLEKMNHKDEHGVNAAYHFYRQQSQQHFSLYHFISVLEKENIMKRQRGKDKIDLGKSNKIMEDNFPTNFVEDKMEEDFKIKEEEKESKGYFALLLICIGILLLLFGNFALIKRSYRLVCMFISVIFFLTGLLVKLKGLWKENKKETTKGKSCEKTDEGERLITKEKEVEDTVFYDSDSSDEILKLQWKEKGRTKQVALRDFPCTVGKIKGDVSVVVNHSSVSRVHCRFVEKDTGIAIMDLNSTNGTYLNGIQVKEGEILEIVKNDEILIGKVKVLVV